jgi:hypothetical protein
MAFSTYSEILAAIPIHLLHAIEPETAAQFVALTESEINRRLRLRQMVVRATTTATDGYLTLPADYAEARNLSLNSGDGRALRLITMDDADHQRQILKGRTPSYFTVVGEQIEIIPAPTDVETEVELTYFARVPALSEETPSNWLLVRSPDLYFYGAMFQACLYAADLKRAGTYRAAFDQALVDLQGEALAAQFGSSPLVMRPRRVF